MVHRLEAVDVALRRKLITLEQIARERSEPTAADFGLTTEDKPDVRPKWMRGTPGPDEVASKPFMIGLAVVCVIATAAYMHGPDTTWIQAVAGSILIAPFVFLAAGIAIALTVVFLNRQLPETFVWEQYQGAKLDHRVFAACRKIKRLESDVRSFYGCSGPEFERLVARSFRKQGYTVQEVGGANDGGVDLVASKGAARVIIQCKALAKPVGPGPVRDLFGALAHSRASHAYLASTNGVSEAAREWAKDKPITFLQPDHLVSGRGF